ncbi:chemotaxis protein CheB [Salinimicrobium oceani]|uniref:protein-glutamate methylesterase n=1 Tax=Salinimicrobium oceani TaxID=2722702 RepID=A0ABX1CTD3_9FLAO|nr:chemotaxis protein CheB [Salinimicrobium oceani]NJW51545.1 chemotaxis protein CheB [Salinimicrobium oceani]
MRNLIVIGASAGGIPAINTVINELPSELDAAVLVVMHVSQKSNSTTIAAGFQRHTALVCSVAKDGALLKKGHLFVAPPGQHLLVKNDRLKLTNGPHENKYRPSIDVLFRSAAVNYGHRTIGIILTGLFEDGTSGMHAIKSSGGICIVQDPVEAQFSDMPLSVLNKIKVDYLARLSKIPEIITEIINLPLPPAKPIPRELQIEAEITEKMMSDLDDMKKIGEHSDFVCPDCGGGLWALKNDPVHRYRCHTGHVFTEKLLHDLQDQKIEESIWVSLRMLEEKENLLLLMTKRNNGNGQSEVSGFKDDRLSNIQKHIASLKALLKVLNQDLHNPPPKMDQ